jgi:hypothetical protein
MRCAKKSATIAGTARMASAPLQAWTRCVELDVGQASCGRVKDQITHTARAMMRSDQNG